MEGSREALASKTLTLIVLGVLPGVVRSLFDLGFHVDGLDFISDFVWEQSGNIRLRANK